MVSIQFSYTSPLKCRCSSPSTNLVSCSPLTSYLYSLSCLSCGYVICGTSCISSLSSFSCGDIICGTSIVYLAAYTTIGTAHTIVGIADGSTLPLIIFCAFISMLSYSFFILKLEPPPSSTLFFFLRNFLESLL